jgi:hypothetical protein
VSLEDQIKHILDLKTTQIEGEILDKDEPSISGDSDDSSSDSSSEIIEKTVVQEKPISVIFKDKTNFAKIPFNQSTIPDFRENNVVYPYPFSVYLPDEKI